MISKDDNNQNTGRSGSAVSSEQTEISFPPASATVPERPLAELGPFQIASASDARRDAGPTGESSRQAEESSQSDEWSLGERLRRRREQRGISLEDAGRTLKLPVRVLRKLESDSYAGIDCDVYLRGYLRSYGGYLGIPSHMLEIEANAHAEHQPVLVPTGGTSHGRYLLQRYAVAGTYLALTALIVVPLLLLGLGGGLQRDLAHLTPLDSAPMQHSSTAPVGASAVGNRPHRTANANSTGESPRNESPDNESPLMASMAPFSALHTEGGTTAASGTTISAAAKPAAPSAGTDGASAVAASGEHRLSLHLRDASWVEVTDAAGERLEYGLLPAGAERSYSSQQPLNVRLGNADGAEVEVDGRALDLGPYRHANVAHFRVFARDGAQASPVDG